MRDPAEIPGRGVKPVTMREVGDDELGVLVKRECRNVVIVALRDG